MPNNAVHRGKDKAKRSGEKAVREQTIRLEENPTLQAAVRAHVAHWEEPATYSNMHADIEGMRKVQGYEKDAAPVPDKISDEMLLESGWCAIWKPNVYANLSELKERAQAATEACPCSPCCVCSALACAR